MSELLLVTNPHKRKRHNPHKRHHRSRHNPHHRRRARHNPFHRRRHRGGGFHRNPSFRGIIGQVMPTIKAGLVGAGGALALDAAWGYIGPKLPSSLSNTYVQFAVKALTAVAIGMIGNRFLRGKGRDLSVGAMTVATHDLLKTTLQTSMPSLFGTGGALALSGYGAYLSGSAPIVGTATFPRSTAIGGTGYGAYLSGDTNTGSGVYVDDNYGMDPAGGF